MSEWVDVMRYKIKDIGEGLDVCVSVTAAWLAAECPDFSLGLTGAGVRLVGRIEPVGEGFLLRGNLSGELVVSCGRCLEPAPVPVEAPIAVTFIEGDEAAEAEGDDASEDMPDDVVKFQRGVIDVGRAIRDEILLAIPMTPVCRPDCAGICPTCGCNRNLTPCGCEKRALETSKLGALAKVKLQ
jgi:uncharacterized protein